MENEEKMMPLPENIQVEESRNSLIITYKWSKTTGYVLLGFSLFWNSFLYFGFISTMIAEEAPTFVLFFMIPFVGAGIFLTYFGIANILNSTIITVGYDTVSVRHAPMAWFGNKDVFKHDIKQLYVKEHINRGKNTNSTSYSVNIVDKDNKDVKLLDALPNPALGKFIEHKIENFLKIQSKPVSGEYNG